MTPTNNDSKFGGTEAARAAQRLANIMHVSLIEKVERLIQKNVKSKIIFDFDQTYRWCPTYIQQGVSEDDSTKDSTVSTVYALVSITRSVSSDYKIRAIVLQRHSTPDVEDCGQVVDEYGVTTRKSRVIPGIPIDKVVKGTPICISLHTTPSPVLIWIMEQLISRKQELIDEARKESEQKTIDAENLYRPKRKYTKRKKAEETEDTETTTE